MTHIPQYKPLLKKMRDTYQKGVSRLKHVWGAFQRKIHTSLKKSLNKACQAALYLHLKMRTFLLSIFSYVIDLWEKCRKKGLFFWMTLIKPFIV